LPAIGGSCWIEAEVKNLHHQRSHWPQLPATCHTLLHCNLYASSSTCNCLLRFVSAGYNTSPTTRRFPVLYMHDGQNAIDPATSFTGVDWGLDEVLVAGAQSGQLQEFITVLVWNTPQRLQEYMPAGMLVPAIPNVSGHETPMLPAQPALDCWRTQIAGIVTSAGLVELCIVKCTTGGHNAGAAAGGHFCAGLEHATAPTGVHACRYADACILQLACA
jgi:hypothetical protein